MKKALFAILAVLAVSGCSAKLPVVMAGNQPFKVNDAYQYESIRNGQPRMEAFDNLDPTPRYLALFHGASEADNNSVSKVVGTDSDNLGKAAIFVAAGSTSAAKTAGLSPLAAANAVTAILTADTFSNEIEGRLSIYSTQPRDGSVTVARFVPGNDIVQGFTVAYPELEPLIRENCNYSRKTLELKTIGDREVQFAPYCSDKKRPTFALGLNVSRFPSLHRALGNGTLVSYTVWGWAKKPAELVALAERLRATLPQDWYVLTSSPAKADAKEPLYHVSKGGVTKSFPVPAEPLAAK